MAEISTALIAAITGLFASGLTYISTSKRDQRAARLEIAKYREKWLQTLRNELVEFHRLSVLAKHKRPDGNFDRVEGSKLLEKSMKIRLLMNPNDPDYELLKDAMGAKIGILTKEELDDLQSRLPEPDDTYDHGFSSTSQRILKREWEKLKKEVRS